MRSKFFIFALIVLILGITAPALAREGKPFQALGRISAPAPGDALQGMVAIVGSTAVEGLRRWELPFAYAQDITNTWFLIERDDTAIRDQTLAEWDTSTITDGTYHLRLTIFIEGGERSDLIVENLRIRNYSPIETSTPNPSPTILITAIHTPIPLTITPLPTNAIEISSSDFSNSLGRGAIIAAVLFLMIGLYISIRKTLR